MAEYLIQDSTLTLIANAIRNKTSITGSIPVLNMAAEIANIEVGGGLNFEVVGSTSQPSNPKENTIWVNTDASISKFSFSVEQPSEPENGIVWFKVADYSFAAFNALKDNVMQIYPLYTRQYINSEWITVRSKLYNGESWIEFGRLSLFDNGDQCTDTTNGWISDSTRYVSENSAKAPTLDFSNDMMNITMTTAGSSYTGSVYPRNNYIDFTPYSKLIVRKTGATNGVVTFMITSSNAGGYSSYNVASLGMQGKDTGTYELDISSINGSYYLFIGVKSIGKDNPNKISINEIYLN